MTGCVKEWIGDGYCDDFNNKAECKFDYGDCCDNPALDWNNYCDECTNCEMWGSPLEPNQCIDSWKNDGFCDDGMSDPFGEGRALQVDVVSAQHLATYGVTWAACRQISDMVISLCGFDIALGAAGKSAPELLGVPGTYGLGHGSSASCLYG